MTSFIWTALTPGEKARVQHLRGLPPVLSSGQVDTRRPYPTAHIVSIWQDSDGWVVYRFLVDGRPVGDTWHLSQRDALDQVEFEFPGLVKTWHEVPFPAGHIDSAAVQQWLLAHASIVSGELTNRG